MCIKDASNTLSKRIIGAAIEVHKELGPGLLENIYEEALCMEFEMLGLHYGRQQVLPVIYKGRSLDCDYRIDILVENKVIVELKSVKQLTQVYDAQLLTYLKISNLWLGMLINFNVPVLRQGVRRIINGQYKESWYICLILREFYFAPTHLYGSNL